MAGRTPERRTVRTVPPKPGWSPSCTSGSPSDSRSSADRDAVAAGERQLQSAPEGEAMDGGDGRAGQRLQAVEDRLAATDEGVAGRLIRERGEFADIGAGDEAALLGRR